jgi:UTP--glucose-1-phosphate uridylyltransferase
MQQVRKAVILAAGLGTRVLPMTKAVPKEMLPIVDMPAIECIVREIAAAGITDILVLTNRGKEVIEDHFDHNIELELALKARGKERELAQIVSVCGLANLSFLRQKEIKGLGHAVLCARNFVGDEPFVVAYADDVIFGDVPTTKQLNDAYHNYGKAACAIKEVTPELAAKVKAAIKNG